MKKVISALLLAACAVVSVHAAPPSQQSLEKLATLTKVEKLHDAMIDNLEQSFDAYVKQILRGEAPTPADKATIDTFRTRMLSLVNSGGLSGADIKTMYEKVYAGTYTQEEVDSLIAYYSTPLGQGIATAQLQVPFKISTMMQQSLSKWGPMLNLESTAAIRKIMQAHAPKPAPQPSSKAAPAAKPAAPAVAPAAAPKGN